MAKCLYCLIMAIWLVINKRIAITAILVMLLPVYGWGQLINFPYNYNQLNDEQLVKFAGEIAENALLLRNLYYLGNQNNMRAFELLAIINERGFHIAKNVKKAREYLLKSAKLGNGRSYYYLAMAYYRGDEITKVSIFNTIKNLEYAHNLQYPPAGVMLGRLYYEGENIPKNYFKARRIFAQKYLNTSGEAQYFNGLMAYYGHGGLKDFRAARKYLTTAASLGNIDAQKFIADNGIR